MSVGGLRGKRDISAPKLPGTDAQVPVKQTEAPAPVVAPKTAPTKFDQGATGPAPVKLEGKSAQQEQVRQSGGLGFDTVSNERPTVTRSEGRQASVGLDVSKLYQPGDRLPVLHGLPPKLNRLQLEVNAEFEADPQKFVERYRAMVDAEGGVPTFVTDDAKGALRPEQWLGADGITHEVKEFRSSGANAAMHQAAHAVTQMAFVEQLDELSKLPPGDPKRNVLVTNGGCGAGKGYALKQGLSADFKQKFGAIWDAAGEQSGLDNKWIIEEAAKRGVKVTLVYVNADPLKAFERAVTKRYEEEGRLVNTVSFAESYVDGGENMRALIRNFDKQPGDLELVVVDNTGAKPTAKTFTRENIGEAQANVEKVIEAGWEDVRLLHGQLKAIETGHLPEHARRGLHLLG